ncbi:MAG: hypothetical protein WCG92_24255 [Hyphomicrobiales bacterium]|nr:hypothetical protein [Alphaproteobacteria bacterium]
MSAQILTLSDYRAAAPVETDIDIMTAVDAAIRDLREILIHSDSDIVRQRAEECELMLRRALVQAVAEPYA